MDNRRSDDFGIVVSHIDILRENMAHHKLSEIAQGKIGSRWNELT